MTANAHVARRERARSQGRATVNRDCGTSGCYGLRGVLLKAGDKRKAVERCGGVSKGQ